MSDQETFKKLAGSYFCTTARGFDELVKDFTDTFAAGRARAEKEIEAAIRRAEDAEAKLARGADVYLKDIAEKIGTISRLRKDEAKAQGVIVEMQRALGDKNVELYKLHEQLRQAQECAVELKARTTRMEDLEREVQRLSYLIGEKDRELERLAVANINDIRTGRRDSASAQIEDLRCRIEALEKKAKQFRLVRK